MHGMKGTEIEGRNWGAYSMRLFGVRGHLQQLLVCQEGFEARVVGIFALGDDWASIAPDTVLGFREHLVHEVVLGAHCDGDDTIPHAEVLAASNAAVERCQGITVGEELHEAFLCLAVGAIHDDMDAHAKLWSNNFGIAAQEAVHLLLCY